jgi:hypothetical protein
MGQDRSRCVAIISSILLKHKQQKGQRGMVRYIISFSMMYARP